MYRMTLYSLLICLLFGVGQAFSKQSGPSIQVVAVFDSGNFKWVQHVTVSDPDGIRSAGYVTPRGNWQSLRVDPFCAKVMTWPVETYVGRIRDVRAEDCAMDLPDTSVGHRSRWHHDTVYNRTGDAVPIVIGWMFERPKGEVRIVSVRVTSGDLRDENDEPLDPSDFVVTGGVFKGFVGKVKGTGTVEITLDPEGDLSIFVFDIYSTAPVTGFNLRHFATGVVCGLLLLALFLLIIRKRKPT